MEKSMIAPLQNQAELESKTPVGNFCECCDEDLLFAMRDKEHTFSLGLSVVIDCLRIAEKEGYLPPLPGEWWTLVENRRSLS